MRFLINLRSIVCIFVFLILTASCKKEDDNTIIVQGNITDANMHTAVPYAEVTFWASRIQSGTFNPNYFALATVTTDANGNYSLQITKDKDAGFRITVEKAKYFGQTTDISVDNLASGTHTLNYSIYPEAYFKLIVKNVSSIDNTDFISYWFNNTQPSGTNCCNNQPINFTGEYYDNTLLCRTFGGQNMHVKWIVRKAGATTPYESTVYCPAFDTTTYSLNY
jgi:hypothetical protein